MQLCDDKASIHELTKGLSLLQPGCTMMIVEEVQVVSVRVDPWKVVGTFTYRPSEVADLYWQYDQRQEDIDSALAKALDRSLENTLAALRGQWGIGLSNVELLQRFHAMEPQKQKRVVLDMNRQLRHQLKLLFPRESFENASCEIASTSSI